MNREYHNWYSWRLNRHMEMLVFGHAGAKLLVFPTSQGRYYEWEDRGMMGALAQHINNGWIQVYCVDSVDSESWYAKWAHPGGRAYRHHQYFEYLLHEVIPLMYDRNPNDFIMTTGASFGAFHAMSFGLKHPGLINRIIGLNGLYDIRMFTDGYDEGYVYFNNPPQFIPNEHDSARIQELQKLDIIMTAGKDDWLLSESRNMSAVLWGKGIGNALREWDGWAHDWPWWMQQITMYIDGHD
jgi:esterase/lipase superfamily enzyme